MQDDMDQSADVTNNKLLVSSSFDAFALLHPSVFFRVCTWIQKGKFVSLCVLIDEFCFSKSIVVSGLECFVWAECSCANDKHDFT